LDITHPEWKKTVIGSIIRSNIILIFSIESGQQMTIQLFDGEKVNINSGEGEGKKYFENLHYFVSNPTSIRPTNEDLEQITSYYKKHVVEKHKEIMDKIKDNFNKFFESELRSLFPDITDFTPFKDGGQLLTLLLSTDDFKKYLKKLIENNYKLWDTIEMFKRLAITFSMLTFVASIDAERRLHEKTQIEKQKRLYKLINDPNEDVVVEIDEAQFEKNNKPSAIVGNESTDDVYTYVDVEDKKSPNKMNSIKMNATYMQRIGFNAVKNKLSEIFKKYPEIQNPYNHTFKVRNKHKDKDKTYEVELYVLSAEFDNTGNLLLEILYTNQYNNSYKLTNHVRPAQPAPAPPPATPAPAQPAPAQPAPAPAPEPAPAPAPAPAQPAPAPAPASAPAPAPAPASAPPLGLTQEQYTQLQAKNPGKVISATVIRFVSNDQNKLLGWKKLDTTTKLAKSHFICNDAPDRTSIRLFNGEHFSVEHIDKIAFTVSPYNPNTDKDLMSKLLSRLTYISTESKYCNSPDQHTYYIERHTSNTGFTAIVLKVIDEDGIVSQCLVLFFKDNDSINVDEYIQTLRRSFLDYISRNIQAIQASISLPSVTINDGSKITEHKDPSNPINTLGDDKNIPIYVKKSNDSKLYHAQPGTIEYVAFNEIQKVKTVPLRSYRINPTNKKNTTLFLKIIRTEPLLVVEIQESNVGSPHTNIKRRFVTTDFNLIQANKFPIIPQMVV
jgi:hypothetical protein